MFVLPESSRESDNSFLEIKPEGAFSIEPFTSWSRRSCAHSPNKKGNNSDQRSIGTARRELRRSVVRRRV